MFSVYSVASVKPGIQCLSQQMRLPFTLAKRRIDDKHPIPFVVNIVRKEILKLNKSSLKVDYIKRFNINN